MRALRFIVTAAAVLTIAGCSTSKLGLTNASPREPEAPLMRDDHGNVVGCSWYCGAPPIEVKATSTYQDGIDSYAAENAHDRKKGTVWVEGVEGPGIGERLIFVFDLTDRERYPESYSKDYPELGINQVSIINGLARSKRLWKKNARVKTLKLYFDGRFCGAIELDDTPEPRWVELPRIGFSPGRNHELAFEIAEVYPGSEYEDTALADFFFSGFGAH